MVDPESVVNRLARLDQLLAALEPAGDYAGVFGSLRAGGVIDAELAARLARAAGQRNLLVHDYLAIDDRIVFGSLASLADLRRFATAVQRLLDADG